MPSHSEGLGIWLSVWRFLLTHCLYKRAAEVLARLRRLTWTFAARIGDKYQIRWTRPNLYPDILRFWFQPHLKGGICFFFLSMLMQGRFRNERFVTLDQLQLWLYIASSNNTDLRHPCKNAAAHAKITAMQFILKRQPISDDQREWS